MNSTLKIGNLVWEIGSYNGRAYYIFQDSHVIRFDPATNGYMMFERGREIAWGENAAKCLEESSQIVLDYIVRNYVPVWELAPELDMFEVGPDLCNWFN